MTTKICCDDHEPLNPTFLQEDQVYRKITRQILPLLLMAFVVAYLDRVNIGFAKHAMQVDLGFSDAVYGFGAGVFFLGYFIFEVPSNLLLRRFGARLWMGRIMISWGIMSASTAFVTNEWQFYFVRFCLGIAEAGFFPGVILYLTYWYPSYRRGRITSIFMSGVALAGVVGGPVSGWILQYFDGIWGHQGWQWMYTMEAVPAVFLGVVLMLRLSDGIEAAPWLTTAEKNLLLARLRADVANSIADSGWSFLGDRRIWLMTCINFSLIMGLYGISFWLPTLISQLGVQGNLTIGLLSAIPWIAAVITMILVANSADRHRERRWHLAIPAFCGALGLILSVIYKAQAGISFVALILATMGIEASLPLFWSLPTALLAGTTAAAAAIAMINSMANLAGFASPSVVGWLNEATGSTDAGMYLLAVFLVLAGLLTLSLPKTVVNR